MSRGLGGGMRPKRQRLMLVLLAALFVGGAVGVSLVALNDNLDAYRDPSQVADEGVEIGKRFKVGGLVAQDSVEKDGIVTTFRVTDGAHQVTISYDKILPDLFRECTAVIAIGSLKDDGVFMAEEVLAKHDENYMPPEVAESLKGDTGCVVEGMNHRTAEGEG